MAVTGCNAVQVSAHAARWASSRPPTDRPGLVNEECKEEFETPRASWPDKPSQPGGGLHVVPFAPHARVRRRPLLRTVVLCRHQRHTSDDSGRRQRSAAVATARRTSVIFFMWPSSLTAVASSPTFNFSTLATCVTGMVDSERTAAGRATATVRRRAVASDIVG